MTTFAMKVLPSLRTRRPSASYFPDPFCRSERELRDPLLAIVFGVEAGEVLADNFF